jgi:hypothetical protein
MQEMEQGKLNRRFERLVDGELSREEYAALLNSLDQDPDGWRQCALAFLESQALAEEFGSVRRTLDRPPPSPLEKQPTLATRDWQRPLYLLAIAASFLAALSAGLVAPRFFPTGEQEPSITGNFQPPSRHEVLKVGDVRLVMDGGDGQPIDAGRVPVYEAGQNLDELLQADQQAISPLLMEVFQRNGFEIQHQPQYVPAPLEDGRQLVVPLDGYQLTPIGRKY